MELLFMKLIEALPVTLIAITMGWLGSFASSYYREKGSNLATKEDIEEITSKIESIKADKSVSIFRTTTFIERQVQAVHEIISVFSELKIYCFRGINQQNEHAVPCKKIEKLSGFQRAGQIKELAFTHEIYLNESIKVKMEHLAHTTYILGQMETYSGVSEDKLSQKNEEGFDNKIYRNVMEQISEIIDDIKKLLHDE